MPCHSQGFHKCAYIEGYIAWEMENCILRDANRIAKTSSTTTQSDKTAFIAYILRSCTTGNACRAENTGLHYDWIPNFEVGSWTNFFYDPAKLMTKGYRKRLTSDRMRFDRGEVWPSKIFVEA